MEDIGTIRLGGAPLPELTVTIAILTEQPKQSETDKHAQKRFVDALIHFYLFDVAKLRKVAMQHVSLVAGKVILLHPKAKKVKNLWQRY
jgi:hypothetical protein